ncbi:MAG: DUF3854 domain-containing protein [Muribaculaceae bacterium]|nr:DUF3854 domain-containing protein [Muribaculaceae bacterium]
MYYKKSIEELKERASIFDFLSDVNKKGKSISCTCPACGEKAYAMESYSKEFIKCRKCGFYASDPIAILTKSKGLGFKEAVEQVADRYGFHLLMESEYRSSMLKKEEKKISGTFLQDQLKASGLSVEDITMRVKGKSEGEYIYKQIITSGSMDPFGDIFEDQDDMLIHYYNLYRSPVTLHIGNKLKNYIRVRWAMPEAKRDKFGKPVKYQTIKGAKAKLFFPPQIIDAFENGEDIPVLVIQEGEKKAIKACKHGIPSVAIQGIFNIGTADDGLISDLRILVKKCNVKKIIMLYDSDWDHLSKNLQPGDKIDQRPNQFSRAAIKFKQYIGSLQNVGIFVDIYFGHINENAKGDKGIDDLLCNSLSGDEDALAKDLTFAINAENGKGEYLTIHKITTLSDIQIRNFWDLSSADAFFERYKDRIKDLDNFKFGNVLYIRKDGKIQKSNITGSDKDFWIVESRFIDKDNRWEKKIDIDTLAAENLLRANGFGAVKIKSEDGSSDIQLVHIEDNIARRVSDFELRDFLFNFAMQNCKDYEVHRYLHSKLALCMGRPQFERFPKSVISASYEQEAQTRHYFNGQIRISSSDIALTPRLDVVWENNIIERNFKRIKIFEAICRADSGNFTVQTTDEGSRCEFLQFLTNTSDFYKDKDESEMSSDELFSIHNNLMNKLSAIGFLLFDCRNPSDDKAVIAMDGTLSEVGKSCGRSGKSLIGKALEQMVDQAYIDGKELDSNSESFMFSDVTRTTRNVFFDDVKINFRLDRLFNTLTGPMIVNPKMGGRFKLPYMEVPKSYVTTNHAIDDDSPSAKDRIALILFSNWYNANHKPSEEFGHNFFFGWDDHQWNLFDNLMAECVQIYLMAIENNWGRNGSGIIEAPRMNIILRELRQKMGEEFLSWGEIFFSEDSEFLNARVSNKTAYDDFCAATGQGKFVSIRKFNEKLVYFCQYAGLHLNPHRPTKTDKLTFRDWMEQEQSGSFIGDRDASSGKVYISVCSNEYARKFYS